MEDELALDPEFALICDQRRERWLDALEQAQQELEFDGITETEKSE